MRKLVLGSLLLLLVGGCRDYVEKLFEEQQPEVDPRVVFPTFAPAAASEDNADDAGRWSFEPCDGWQEGTDRRLRLGGLFTAELPPEAGWASAESSRATILVRYPSGTSLPSAYLYAEKIDAEKPGAGLGSFLHRVDRRFELPELSDLIQIPQFFGGSAPDEDLEDGTAPPKDSGDPPEDLTAAPIEEKASEEDTGADGPAAGVEPTEGSSIADGLPASSRPAESVTEALETLEPGYTSEDGSFSGWKWLGTCTPSPRPPPGAATDGGAMKPFLRFARSRGEWRLQPGVESKPAFQILATVTLPDRRSYGVHLAIVCTAVPQCTEGPALSRLLGSLRVAPGAGGAAGDGWGNESLRELAEEVGISVSESQNQ